MVVQFICRGNTFRSIMAEAYLRSLHIPGVVACSSGTVGARDKAGNTPNYHRVLSLLKRRGVAQFAKPDFGEDVQQAVLDKSDIVVFMNERAREEAARKFTLPKETLVWDVSDLSELARIPETEEERVAAIEKAYAEITAQVDRLVQARHLQS